MVLNPVSTYLYSLDNDGLNQFISLVQDKIKEFKGMAPSQLRIVNGLRMHQYCKGSTNLVATWSGFRLNEAITNSLDGLVWEIESPSEVYKPNRPVNYRTFNGGTKRTIRGYTLSEAINEKRQLFYGRIFSRISEADAALKAGMKNWLFKGKNFLEFRSEGNRTMINVAEYLVRISRILAGDPITDKSSLIYDIYRSMMMQQIDPKVADELIGLNDVIDFMRWSVFGASAIPAAKHYGLRNEAVMLAGVYGVGKTSIAKVLAIEDNKTIFVPIEALTLVESLLEKSSTPMSLFENLRKLKTRIGIQTSLFCDDIESAMMDPESTGVANPTYLAGTSSLLNKLEGIQGSSALLCGSTNNPFIVDPRYLEFGRVGYVLHTPLPNEENRRKTFEVFLRSKPVESGIDLSTVAKLTDGFSYRSIREMCNKAGEAALKRAAMKIRREGESLFEAAKRVDDDVAKRFPISDGDIAVAIDIVRKFTDIKDLKELDDRIAKFCNEFNPIGFKL